MIRALLVLVALGSGLVAGHMLNVNWLVALVSLGIGFLGGVTVILACVDMEVAVDVKK